MAFFYGNTYRKSLYLFILILAFPAFVSATNDGLVTVVLDAATKQPIQSVSIYNFERGFSTATNEFGEANIHSLRLEDSITFSYIGFETVRLTFGDLLGQSGRVFLQEGLFLQEFTVKGATRVTDHISNIPAQVDILKAEDIALINPQTSADALLSTGNVFVQKSQMGGGSPVIRGFEANKVLIVVDGVRMNNAIYRNGHLQNAITIDNNMLERLEVVYGPSAVIYGSDALGGVMSFTTKRPRLALGDEDSNFEGNAFIRYNTANQERTAHLDFNVGGRKWASITSASASSFGNLRTGRNNRAEYIDFGKRFSYVERINGQDSVVQNENPLIQVGTAYSQIDLLQKVLFQPNKYLNFTANIQYSTSTDVPRYDQLADSEVSIVDGIRNESFRFAEWYYGPQSRLMTSLSSEYQPDDNRFFTSMNTVAAYQKIEEDRITRRFGRDNRSYQEEDVHIFSLNIDFAKDIQSNFRSAQEDKRFLYGLEVNHNRVNSTAYSEDIITGETANNVVTRYPDGGNDMTMMAAYMSYRQKFRNRFNVTAGVRYTYTMLQSQFIDTTTIQLPYTEISSNLGALTGSVSLVWDVGNDWFINAVASTAFRSPNIDDFGKIRAKNEFVTVPNPDLSSEYALNGEMTITKKFEKGKRSHSINATGFYTHLFDAIVRDFTTLNGVDSLLYDGDYYTTQWNTNAGTAFIYGVSGNIKLELSENWELKSSVNYIKGWNTFDDSPLAHIPPLYGQTTLSYNRKRFQFRFLSRYNGWKRVDEFDNEGTDNLEQATIDGSPSWVTFNFYTNFKIDENLFISLAVENLLDTHYRPFSSGVSAAGRSATISLRTTF